MNLRYTRIQFVCACALAFASSVSLAGKPRDVNVTNFPSVQTVDGTVEIGNFPRKTPFARSCVARSSDSCVIDLSSLAATGEVHITQASGQAIDVGTVASPRFFNGRSSSGPEVLLPHVVNTADTGNERDVLFSQSMDLIPVAPEVGCHEPGTTDLYCYIHGYVVTTSTTATAVATQEGIPFAVKVESP